MLSHFTFNGHSTSELGLLVSGINIYGSPSRIVEKVTIPYRSGDLLIDTGAYTNYMLTYTVDIMDNTKATAEAISKWLLGSKGYCELTDTYNPEIYRVASYYNQLDYTLSALYRYGKATITFDCKPQKYLTANQPVSLSSTLSEETSYSLSTPAMPLPLTLEGNTTQNTLSGKNLAQLTPQTRTVNGVTVTIDSNLLVTVNGTATAGGGRLNFFSDVITLASGTYDFRKVMMSGTAQVPPYLSNSSTNTAIGWATPDGRPFTVSASTPAKIGFNFENGTTYNEKFYLQLEQGSTPTAYEPYCGGIPSPNPDYPQEIHSVKGDNEIRVVGFNLFDKNAMVKGYYISDGDGNQQWDGGSNSTNFIQVIPSQKYYIKSEATAGRWGAWYDIDKNYISGIVGVNTIFTAPSNAHFMRMTVSRPTTGNPDTFCINVSDTEKNGTYEPYKAQVYPINLPVENLFNFNQWANDIGVTRGTKTVSGNSITLTATSNDCYTQYNNTDAFIPIPVTPNTDYTLSWKANNNNEGLVYLFDGADKTHALANANNKTAKSVTINTGSLTSIAYRFGVQTSGQSITYYDIQLERGSKANSYTPYGISPIELNALGNYNDYFHKTDGKWYLHKATGTANLGDLEWSNASACAVSTKAWTHSPTLIGTILPSNNATVGNMLSTKFVVAKANEVWAGIDNRIAVDVNSYVAIFSTTITEYTATQIKTVLNGTIIVFALATPTETEITDATLISQLNALSKAKTYDGSTTIVQEGTDAQFKLSMPVPAEVTSEYKGEPIITVNEVGTIVWNDSLIKVNSAPVTINSQTLQCYYYSENKNNDVEINEFPKYEQGENYIGSTMALTVVPNYWKL